jgi:hypothetical protein
VGRPIAIQIRAEIAIHDVGSDVRVGADSGGVHLDNINGPAVVHVDSGGIEATQVAGSIDVQADSGGIRVAQARQYARQAPI